MAINLSPLDDIHVRHGVAGNALFEACTAELFPCDVLAYAVLERSLNLIKGFRLILENGGYSSAIGLLRMQLDNILRFNGIVMAEAPHDVANKVIHGTSLSKIKDRTGELMRDARLVQMLQQNNPWVKDVYDLASGYIHLSKEHILQFTSRCPLKPDGTREFCIGDEENHIPQGHKDSLVEGFIIVSRGVPRIVTEWSKVRHIFGSSHELRVRFEEKPGSGLTFQHFRL